MSDWASEEKAYKPEDGMPKEPQFATGGPINGWPKGLSIPIGFSGLSGKSFMSMLGGGVVGFNAGSFDHLMDSLAMTMRPLKVRTDHRARAALMVYDEFAGLDDMTVTKESWVEARGLNKPKTLRPKNNPKGNPVYGTTWRKNK